MKTEDEPDEDGSSNIRYPCMPSLVALQQMRNRLHLAFVGKKLMKWTAQATGRELRKVASDLNETCKSYPNDMKDGYILLARSRYFYPNLNKMVLEHVGREASITVSLKAKSMAGVKILHLVIMDSDHDNYRHLGIDKGGQTILEAKQAWRILVARVILLQEQRTSFHELDIAHKSATKKKNVLSKVVIPRLKATIKFIKQELEEKEREEIFRLKRFKQLKIKHAKTLNVHVCCCCLSMFAPEEDAVESTCPVCKKAAHAKGKVSEMTLNIVPCKTALAEGKENKKMLDHLMSHIDDVINLTRQYKLDGIVPASVDRFIKTCNQVKETIEDYANGPPLCDVCKKFLEANKSRIKLGKSASSKSMDIESSPKRTTTEAPPCTESCYNLGPEPDDKLGYFEKKFKEIVKVTRLKNEDGSVSEEKQVITIRTERRNPRKKANFDSTNDDSKFISGGGGGNGPNDYGGGTDYGGDEGCNFRPGPRHTKSEHTNRSQQMDEPKLRSCISGSNIKKTMNKDESTNFGSSRCMSIKTSKITLPPRTSDNKMKTCGPLPKISKSSSIDHVCCPRKSLSVCGSELDSGGASQASIVPTKPVTESASAQTCCKEVPIKKPMEDKGTCCLPTCGGDKTCVDNKDSKFKSTSTDALWRDVTTSTTDLLEVPCNAPSKGIIKCQNKKASPAPSCSSKDSDEVEEKKTKRKSGSCCTIKIIAKAPKNIDFEEKPKGEPKVVLPGSMFDTLKYIFLPPTASKETCKPVPREPEIKSICKSCLSKLNSFASTKPSIKSQSSSCKMCQASIASAEETKSCPSCGTLAKSSSCGSMSCKSMAIGSSTSQQVCQGPVKSPTPSQHSQKHKCCLEKKSNNSSSEEEEQTCCAMSQASKSSKSVCCSVKKTSSVCCPAQKSSTTSVKSTKSAAGSCCAKSDAMTSTKRSAKFDVRPVRRKHTCERINLSSCTCQSDPVLNRNTGRKRPPKRSQSFYEDEYYYFKW